ncbi:DNA polymerase III subunit epsilon [Camelimonas lactis]|uniref:DNA polymerase III subunit epsilon n=1 Tax=Camelimonas lactis TaxID=659006 RepID=A0A4R2GVK7_9HYPH|nr:DNA polymerase III subunit epsilon [Camelimonas lactis]TCO14682.1 DNA polymerase-3 subunit epsilon [Camelimonas lactis]
MKLREIVFDTETTGVDPHKGDRIVEIGCVEILDHLPTGNTFHCYINPQRDMPAEAFAVHGLSAEFLADKPVFASVADDFRAFIGDAPLVAHNAQFDVNFINAEFARLGVAALDPGRIVDTLFIARRKHPGANNSLDGLCSRYGIDNSRRTKHGALLDAEILAEVYLELRGGRQTGLDLSVAEAPARARIVIQTTVSETEILARSKPLPSVLTEDDLTAHRALVASMKDKAIWLDYIQLDDAGAEN